MNDDIDPPVLADQRAKLHDVLMHSVMFASPGGIPSIADKASSLSRRIAQKLVKEMDRVPASETIKGQTAGNRFETACTDFITRSFSAMHYLRPGNWIVKGIKRDRLALAEFIQYAHLVELNRAAKANAELATILGSDYLIAPDIVIGRVPEPDAVINNPVRIVDGTVAMRADLRSACSPKPILHASISCKWTIRSDRAQNSRSEALNLMRNRKGRLPHIVVVIAEPLPTRIASIALGTGDIDCVYHIALPELIKAVGKSGDEGSRDLLAMMVNGRRLKDIADLPLDLAV